MSLRVDDPQNHAPDLLAVAEDELDPTHWTHWDVQDDVTPTIRVTAVLVAHDGAPFLPRTLDAIEAQSRRPDALVAVDAGSLDGSGDLLALATEHLLRLNRDTSFGDAVQAALTALEGHALAPAPDPRPSRAAHSALAVLPQQTPGHLHPVNANPAGTEWLWLLHDDSAPAPDALERLVEAVDAGPSIAIAGCKQVSWTDGRRLLDVGFTTSRLGARVTGIDVDDVDQGQLDHRSDVLAVGTAGMLVRRDVWERLGGPDPALTHARDDLDFCRRAHLSGGRVVVVPQAVIAHAAATASGLRTGTGGASWALRDRRAAVHLRLASVPLLLLPALIVWLALAALVRALGRLMLKQPDRAGAELAAFGLVLIHPPAWLRARRRTRSGRRLPRRDYRRLLAGPRQTLRQRRDLFSSYLRKQEEAWTATTTPAPAPTAAAEAPEPVDPEAGADPLPAPALPPEPAESPLREAELAALDDDLIPLDDERPRLRRRPQTRIAVAVAALTAVAAATGLRLLLRGNGVPIGPGLIPAPEKAHQLWNLALSGWRPLGLGQDGVGDPFDAVLAVLAWPLGGSTRAATELLLIGALPLAAVLAWWASGVRTGSRALRAWAALGWAAAPSLLLSVAAGRIAVVVAHLALPPLALAVARTIGLRPVPAPGKRQLPVPRWGSITAASGAGLLLTVLIAAAPSLAGPALLALLVTVALAGRGRWLLGWTALIPGVLLLPWWQAVVAQPRLLLAEPGGPGSTPSGSSGWSAALWPSDPATFDHGPLHRLARLVADLTQTGDAALWLRAIAIGLAVPLLLLGLSALVGRRRRPAAVGLWLVALSALGVAVLMPILQVRPGSGGSLRGGSAAGVSLLTLMVLAAALTRLDGAAGRLRSRSLGLLHWFAVGTGIVAVLAPLLVLAGWSAEGWSAGPGRWVHGGAADVLPGVAAAEANGPAATRTLVLRAAPGGIRWSLYRSGGPRLGQESAAVLTPSSTTAATAGDGPLLTAIGGLLSGAGSDQRDRLADLDIGSVLLLAPATDELRATLDTAPGLVRVSTPKGGVLWRVELDGTGGGPTRPARVRVLSGGGEVLATLPSDGLDVHADVDPGPAGRLLVLSERADPGWRAWLAGTPLTPQRHAGWAQAFALPTGGGTVTVGHQVEHQRVVGLARLGVLGLALLLAVPLPRRRLRLLSPNRIRSAPPAFPRQSTGRRARSGWDEPDQGQELPQETGQNAADVVVEVDPDEVDLEEAEPDEIVLDEIVVDEVELDAQALEAGGSGDETSAGPAELEAERADGAP